MAKIASFGKTSNCNTCKTSGNMHMHDIVKIESINLPPPPPTALSSVKIINIRIAQGCQVYIYVQMLWMKTGNQTKAISRHV